MTYFEMDYRKIERKPQRHQLYVYFEITMEQIFEILEAEDIETTTTSYPNMIEPIFNRIFGNTFQYQNGPNQRYHT